MSIPMRTSANLSYRRRSRPERRLGVSKRGAARVARWLDSPPPSPDAACVMRDWRDIASRVEALRAEAEGMSCHPALERLDSPRLRAKLSKAAGILHEARNLANRTLRLAEDVLEKERAKAAAGA